MVQAGESQVQVQVSAVNSAFQVCTYRLLYVQAVVTILYSNLLYVQEIVTRHKILLLLNFLLVEKLDETRYDI